MNNIQIYVLFVFGFSFLVCFASYLILVFFGAREEINWVKEMIHDGISAYTQLDKYFKPNYCRVIKPLIFSSYFLMIVCFITLFFVSGQQ